MKRNSYHCFLFASDDCGGAVVRRRPHPRAGCRTGKRSWCVGGSGGRTRQAAFQPYLLAHQRAVPGQRGFQYRAGQRQQILSQHSAGHSDLPQHGLEPDRASRSCPSSRRPMFLATPAPSRALAIPRRVSSSRPRHPVPAESSGASARSVTIPQPRILSWVRTSGVSG